MERRRQTKCSAHTLVKLLATQKGYTNNANRKHKIAIRMIRPTYLLTCSTKRLRNRPLGVSSAHTTAGMPAVRETVIMARINVHRLGYLS
jgi:hypothetical protein